MFRLWKNFKPMNSTIFVLFGKYCPIMDQLGSKDSSRDFQLNCVISYFFIYIYYFMHGSKDWCDGESEKISTFEVHPVFSMCCRSSHPRSMLMYGSMVDVKGLMWTAAENKPLFSFPILPKFHYAKKKFPVTLKCRQMHGVLNVDEIKN
jgi:hypothetical protein